MENKKKKKTVKKVKDNNISITLTGEEKKIKRLQKELRLRIKKDNIILK